MKLTKAIIKNKKNGNHDMDFNVCIYTIEYEPVKQYRIK